MANANALPNPSGPLLYWPAVAAAGVFGLVFVTGLTGAALALSKPSAPKKEKPPPALVAVTPASSLAVKEPEPTPPSEPAPVIDVSLPEPAPARLESGIEQIVAHAAISVPTAVPNPWAPVTATDSPAAVIKNPTMTCGTSVEFVSNPTLADRQARQEHKLVFLLHVSGDFEDPGFT